MNCKVFHESPTKILIIFRVIKDRPARNIPLPPVLSPTQLEHPSFGELEIYQWGKMYGGGGYILISYYLCAIEMLST